MRDDDRTVQSKPHVKYSFKPVFSVRRRACTCKRHTGKRLHTDVCTHHGGVCSATGGRGCDEWLQIIQRGRKKKKKKKSGTVQRDPFQRIIGPGALPFTAVGQRVGYIFKKWDSVWEFLLFWQDTTLFNKFIISFLALSVAPILSPFFLFSSFLNFFSRLVSSCLLTHYLPHYSTAFFLISPSFSFISHNLHLYLDHHFLPPPSFIFSAILAPSSSSSSSSPHPSTLSSLLISPTSHYLY